MRLFFLFLLSLLWTFETLAQAETNPTSPSKIPSLDSYEENQIVAGFQVTKQYLNAQDQAMGLRLVHQTSGTVVHLLQIDTVPQAAIAIRTYNSSNNGAAHALEHILIGKGSTGQLMNLLFDMRLGNISAGTGDAYTWYHFYSGTGMEGFYELFHKTMTALFQPDFTNEEAAYEVYHVGVEVDSQTAKMRPIEQGTVYAEMESNQGNYDYFYEARKMAWGGRHPIQFYGGGQPNVMRTLTPLEVRAFHQKHYVLGPTITVIVVIPPRQNLVDTLAHLHSTLDSLTLKNTDEKRIDLQAFEKSLPIEPAKTAEIRLVPFASQNETDPGKILLMWKPIRIESLEDRLLLDMFLDQFGNGSTSLLYRSLVDQKTHELDIGATRVSMGREHAYSPQTNTVYFALEGVLGNQISKETLEHIRKHILDKLVEVSQYKPGSKELQDLKRKIVAALIGWKRSSAISMTQPPGFGTRRIDSGWVDNLQVLEQERGFRQSLGLQNVLAGLMVKLQSNQNIWSSVIKQAGLLETPYVTAGIPSSALLNKLQLEKQARLNTALAKLKTVYAVSDEQKALARFATELKDKEQIIGRRTHIPIPSFTKHPPLTFDSSIAYTKTRIAGVSSVNSYFPGTAIAEVGLSFDLRTVPFPLLKYLPLLPALLTSIGLKEGGTVTSYQDLEERLNREVYSLKAWNVANITTNRYELRISASGTDVEESRAALQYLQRITHSNYLALENLPRIQDVLEEILRDADGFTKQYEEDWVEEVANAFYKERVPLCLVLYSNPTRAHLFHHLKWQLEGPLSKAELADLQAFANDTLRKLEKETDPTAIEKILTNLKEKGIRNKMVEYFKSQIKHFPPKQIVAGLHRLHQEIMADIQIGKEKTIAEMKQLQKLVLNRSRIHMYQVGDAKILDQLKPDVMALLRSFPYRLEHDQPLESRPLISTHLLQRNPAWSTKYPQYVGYSHEDSIVGNIVIKSKLSSYHASTEKELLQFLAPQLLSGTGPHTLYIKTWQAGLAYGNGLTVRDREENLFYYADRCPSIRETLHFVKKLTQNLDYFSQPSYKDYVLAQVFNISRERLSPTQRGAALLEDLQDGLTPSKIRTFYRKILDISQRKNFLMQLRTVLSDVLNRVILGRGTEKEKAASQSRFFFVGPEKQLHEVEKDIPGGNIARMWASDFWLP